MNVQIYPDAQQLAQAAARHIVARANEAITDRGQFLVALSGGSTPRPTYTLLASAPFAEQIDWSHVHIFWGDERVEYPFDHAESNYRMACETLLDHVPIPPRHVHCIRGELGPQTAADRYEETLRATLGPAGRFDLILLGMGADGHTASLFPGTAALSEQDRWVVKNYVDKLDAWRVTLTFPIINTARHVTFLVSGAAKALALTRVRTGAPLPAAQVQPVQGQLIWMVDREAISTNTVEENR